MSQYYPDPSTIDPDETSGTELANLLSLTFAAFRSAHSGSARPTYAVAGTLWLDTVNPASWTLWLYDGSQDIPIMNIAPASDLITYDSLETVGEIRSNTGNIVAELGNLYLDAGGVLAQNVQLESPDYYGVYVNNLDDWVTVYAQSEDLALTSSIFYGYSFRASSSAFNLLTLVAGGDSKFKVRADGNTYADGPYSGAGADGGETFEWSDGNPQKEDRIGLAVTLDGEKIRPAVEGDDVLGVTSATMAVQGDNPQRWHGQYLKDDFGRVLLDEINVASWKEKTGEIPGRPPLTRVVNGRTITLREATPGKDKIKKHSVILEDMPSGYKPPKDATITKSTRPRPNPAYDPDREFILRSERHTHAGVALWGKVHIRKGQPRRPEWRTLKEVSANVDLILI